MRISAPQIFFITKLRNVNAPSNAINSPILKNTFYIVVSSGSAGNGFNETSPSIDRPAIKLVVLC
jgi:hypothetical protein